MGQTLKVRKDDTVEVMKGKDRGKRGRVLETMPRAGRVLVENLNIIVKHQRPRPIQNANRMGGQTIIPGGRIEQSAPLQVSNAMAVCPTANRPTPVPTLSKTTQNK